MKNITGSLGSYYQKLDDILMQQVCEKLAEIESAEPTDISGLDKMQDTSGAMRAIEKGSAEALDNTTLEIYNILESIVREYYEEATKSQANRVPYGQNHAVTAVVEQTKRGMARYMAELLDTNDIGFACADGMFRELERAMRYTVINAIMASRDRRKNYGEYTSAVVGNAAEQGLANRLNSTARTRSIGASCELEVRYRVTQMVYMIAELLAKDTRFADGGGVYMATGYEIDWHAGHRPEHWFGGRQFTFEQMKTQGIERMLNDYNCRHWKFPVVVGVTTPMYSAEELARLEKAETDTHEWNGKLYTLYELTQKRNELKRAAAKKQREIAGLDALGDDRAYEKKGALRSISEAYASLSQFIDSLMNPKPKYPPLNPSATEDDWLISNKITNLFTKPKSEYEKPPEQPANDEPLTPLTQIPEPEDEVELGTSNMGNAAVKISKAISYFKDKDTVKNYINNANKWIIAMDNGTIPMPTGDRYNFHLENVRQLEVNYNFDDTISNFKKIYKENIDIYKEIAKNTGLPPELIAAIHYRESGCNFNKTIKDGSSLPNGVSFIDDAINILNDDYYNTMFKAADAYNMSSDSVDVVAMMSFAEAYNGTGYYKMGLNSPYLYSGTNLYTKGKYDRDGHYNPDLIDNQPGIFLLICSILFDGR